MLTNINIFCRAMQVNVTSVNILRQLRYKQDGGSSEQCGNELQYNKCLIELVVQVVPPRIMLDKL